MGWALWLGGEYWDCLATCAQLLREGCWCRYSAPRLDWLPLIPLNHLLAHLPALFDLSSLLGFMRETVLCRVYQVLFEEKAESLLSSERWVRVLSCRRCSWNLAQFLPYHSDYSQAARFTKQKQRSASCSVFRASICGAIWPLTARFRIWFEWLCVTIPSQPSLSPP